MITGMLQFATMELMVWETCLRPTVSVLNNRQRRYGLRHLGASRTQPTRDILPVTLKEGEEQPKPGEQPENDDIWTRPSRARRGNLGQRLVRKIVAKTDIYSTLGTE